MKIKRLNGDEYTDIYNLCRIRLTPEMLSYINRREEMFVSSESVSIFGYKFIFASPVDAPLEYRSYYEKCFEDGEQKSRDTLKERIKKLKGDKDV